jgi:dynein heavy chain
MVIASMGSPGGGKSFITPRFQRHFNIVAFANFDEVSLNTIFRNLLKWHFREGGFNPDVTGLEQKIVQATFKIYEKIQAELRPTPAKTHYTFNLRDFSKIICGFCNCKKEQL